MLSDRWQRERMEKQIHILPALLLVCPAPSQLEGYIYGAATVTVSFLYINMQNGAECCAATQGLFNRGYTVSMSFLSATPHVGLHKHSPLYVNRLRMRYTCYTGKIHKMPLPSLMSYQAWSDTVPSQHTNTTATARILQELVRATETTSSSRHTHRSRSSSSTGAEKRQKHTATLTQKEQSCLCFTHRIFNGPFGSLERHAPPILLLWSLLLPGIWKQARQGTHYIHVPLSPACHKLPFPSPVGRQLIRQQWASQPASQRCELWAPDHFLSLSPPSLSFSLCFYPPALALPLSHCPLSLSSSSSPAVRCSDSRWNQFTLPSSPLPFTADGDQADLHQGTAALDGSLRGEDGFSWEEGSANTGDGEEGKWGLNQTVDGGEGRVYC